MLFVGTSGKGLVLGVRAAGQVALLADSPFTEISDLLWTPDGSVWAVALVGEPVKRAPVGGKDEAEPTTVELDLPKIDGATATSEVLRLTPEGALLKVHRFAKQVAVALAWDGEGVLVGTGFEGELWRFLPGGGARLASVDAVQVTAIVDGGSALLTQGPGGVLLRDGGPDRDARFRIDAKRFERPVRFGELRIVPANPEVRIRFRSGIAEKPDETWLPWSAWVSAEGGVVPLPPATSLQWELDLPRREQATSVERVEVAYREVNLPPRLESVEVEDPGVVYLSAPPPSGPVIDVAHPDFSGVFTVIDEKGGGNSKPKQGKKYWRVGFRTVNWKAEDPNGDPMRFQLELEHPDGFRLPVRERLETTQVALDTTAVPDGWYRFWIQASDEHGNPEQPLEATAYSRWFTVDNTPPEVQLRRQGDDWMVTVSDALSSLSRVEWARDGERWHGLAPEDGVLDGRAESFHFGAASGNHMVVVRAIDRQHNRVVTGVVEE
jgi:hypothetical protein